MNDASRHRATGCSGCRTQYRLDGRRSRAAEDAVQLRRLGVGVLLAADGRRATGRRAPGRPSATRRTCAQLIDASGHHDAALRAVDAAALPRTSTRAAAAAAVAAPRDLQRRGAAAALQRPLLRAPARRRAAQPVRPDRSGGRRHRLGLRATRRADRVPIGRPIANTQIYVLDAQLQPVPHRRDRASSTSAAWAWRAAICNRPELTAERFVPDPFSAEPAARLYRTGDLGALAAPTATSSTSAATITR